MLSLACLSMTAQMKDGTYEGFKVIKNQEGPDIITINVLSLGNGSCRFSEDESKKPLDGTYHIIVNRHRYATGNFAKGIANGDWEEYIDDELYEKGFYKNGKYDGKAHAYKRLSGYHTIYDMKEGVIQHAVTYYESGQLHIECFYDENGKRNGDEITYDKDGNVIGKQHYLHGSYHGKQMEIGSDGYKKTSEYNNGTRVGEYCRLYPNGNIAEKGTYDENGNKTGKWIWGQENGNISTEATYLDGKLNGEERTYYKNGLPKRVAEYTNGKRNGKTVYYNEEPHVISEEGMFVDEQRHGEYKIYSGGILWKVQLYQNSTAVSEKVYENGKLRTLRLLNENGSLVNVEQYNNAGKKTYENKEYKKHPSVKLKENASGVIDVEIE